MEAGQANGPVVSVVVPARNAEDTLPALLGALERQTAPKNVFEVVVVDDGSSDGTAELAARSELVRVVRLPARAGRASARNRGVEAARGTVLAFTDADCRPDPGWIACGLASLDGGGIDIIVGNVEIPLGERPSTATLLDAARHLDQERFASEGYGATANLFVRRGVFSEVGLFNPRLIAGEDAELCHRAVAAGARLDYAADAVVSHDPRTRLSELARKAFRLGAAAAQQRYHADSSFGPFARFWSQRLLYLPSRTVIGLERLARRGYRPGRAGRLALIAAQYACIQLPLALGDLASSVRERLGSRRLGRDAAASATGEPAPRTGSRPGRR